MVYQGRTYRPSKNVLENVIYARDTELVVSGPAGTGKSRGVLEKIYLTLARYPGSRALMFRKVRASLNKTGIVTWEQHVLPPQLGVRLHSQKQCYTLPNGSVLDVAGLDDPEKIKSGEWDIAYGQEITECDEEDWEIVGSRLRNGVVPYQMLIGDCNPSHPRHWVRLRTMSKVRDFETDEERTKARMVEVLHRDNPRLWDPDTETWTEYGKKYISRLRDMTGVRRLRYYKGLWAAAEGLVYEDYSEDIHLTNPFVVPHEWPAYFAVDFGFTNPFVWQCWRYDEANDVLYLTHEIYMTGRIVEGHAEHILQTMKEHRIPNPSVFVADHDADGVQTLAQKTGFGIINAHKSVLEGLDAVRERMKHTEGSRPRIKIFRNARVHDPDQSLVDQKKPLCTEDEILGYVIDKPKDGAIIRTAIQAKRAEMPIKFNDHGCDGMRYMVAQKDIVGISNGVYF